MPNTNDFSPSMLLTLAFAAALVIGLALKFWLASRQIRHVARHRLAGPADEQIAGEDRARKSDRPHHRDEPGPS